MFFFSLLHLSIEIANSSFELLNFFARIVVEVMDHVLFNLEHVALDLGLLELLLEVGLDGVELFDAHLGVFVDGLLLLLLSLLATLLATLFFSSHLLIISN